MTSGSSSSPFPLCPILLGTLAVAVLDITDAFVYFGLRHDVAPIRILQSVASGVLGRPAYQGGVPTAALGAVLHTFIAFCIVTTYTLASRRMPSLWRHPLVYGPLYGIAVYLVMNLIVVPLSAAATGKLTPPTIVNGLLIHMLGVGLPSALAARSAWSNAQSNS